MNPGSPRNLRCLARKSGAWTAEDVYVSDARLTPEEDAELRLLNSLRGFGAVAHSITARYNALRGRDRRTVVREPDESQVATAVEKNMWGDSPVDKRSGVGEQTMSDAREIIAAPPDAQKRGLFRR